MSVATFRAAKPNFRRKIDGKTILIIVLITVIVLQLAINKREVLPHPQLNRNAQATPQLPTMQLSTPSTNVPDVIIYRRTKKTGSSSMVQALIQAAKPLGFYPIPLVRPDITQRTILHMEAIRQPQRKLLFLEHNALTRSSAPGRNVIILDTIRDGFLQITSYCRHTAKVEDCSENLIECLKGEAMKRQMSYRWAGAEGENADNYIDIPLSSEHPALSTSALRTVFPNVTLDVKRYNARGSACSKTDELLKVYNKVYADLDIQNRVLGRRLLTTTGYFLLGYDARIANASIWQMLDAAEEAEKRKYGNTFEETEQTRVREVGGLHGQMWADRKQAYWEWRDGKLVWVDERS